MNDTSTIAEQNAYATVEEYRKAVVDGATTRAANIRTANPDLEARFDSIDKTRS